jgi:hypothetical protein
MHQRRRVERLPGLLVGQFRSCQPPQLVIDQGQKLRGGERVAGFDSRQDECHVAHAASG